MNSSEKHTFWRSRDWWWVFGLALALRLFVVAWLNFAPPHLRPVMGIFANDALTYNELGQNLLAGEGYHYQGDYLEVSSLPPLFPVLLAAIYGIFGHSVFAVGVVNAVLGALTAWWVYLIAWHCFAPTRAENIANEKIADLPFDKRDFWTRRVALTSGLIFAAYPLEIFNTPFVLKENLSIFLTTGFALAWMRLLCVQRIREIAFWAMWAGFALGLSILSRLVHVGVAALFVMVSLILVWRQVRYPLPVVNSVNNAGWRWTAAGALITLLICALTVSPLLVRNYRVFGQVTLSSQGPARYLFNSTSRLARRESNGYYEGSKALVQHNGAINVTTRRDPQKRERIFARLAWRNILSNPGHILYLTYGKVVSMWRPVWENSSLRSWLLLGVPYIMMMAFAIPGLWLAPRCRAVNRADAAPLQVLYVMTAFYVVGHAVFYGMIRERQYVEPYLIVFAAAAAFYFYNRRAQNNSGQNQNS